jgi:AraC-like DNA-binding protein
MKMIIYRASSLKDSAPLPLYLRATGWHTARQGWTEENDGKDRNYSGLFWCMDGSAKFTINNKKHIIKAGQVLYYLPYDSHFIEIISKHCTYYWVTFDGPLHVDVMKSFKYPRAPFRAKGYLVALFEEMFEILHDLTPIGLQRASQALYNLLIAIGSSTAESRHNTRNQQLTRDFVELTAYNFKNESYNVSAAAEILKVHRTTLGKALKEQLNINPNTYIVNIRLQYALKMLHETDLKASEIAVACGIPDPCYFSKLIKQLTGLPPHKLRNN